MEYVAQLHPAAQVAFIVMSGLVGIVFFWSLLR